MSRPPALKLAPVVAAVAFVGAALLVACGPEPLGDGYETTDVNCTACHGRGDDPAPPRSVSGSEEPSTRGVGAHRKHLRDGVLRAAVQCSECHVVPKHVDDPGHLDGLKPARVTFGPLASAHDASPAWNPQTLTCATYCHGATLQGGTHTTPTWTKPSPADTACGACHGFPPPAPHPKSTRCSLCHQDTVDDVGRIKVASGKHMNGVVDSKGTTCNSCHGHDDTGAPPADLHGNTATTSPGVGAHATHLSSVGHQAVACSDCHVVPQHFGDPGHADDNDETAEVTFGGLAVHDGALPSYAGFDVGCKNTYCHGGTLPGAASRPAPVWTVVDGTFTRCDACHGYPPAAPHPARNDCSACHGMVVNADNTTFVAPALHVDGVVESAGTSCNSCHGNDQNAAPPRDTLGNTSTSARGVGAHQSHLQASDWHAPVACSECHVVPASPDDAGHYDSSLPAEVTFGPVAGARGAHPSWDGAGCSNIACHGGDAVGGTNHAPSWTTVDGTQAACGTCHALPPPAPHPARDDCASCHGDVVDANRSFTNPALHVNGVVNVSCNACHGDATSPAPPQDLEGNTDTIFPGVGAHRAHLVGNELHGPVACSECHKVPAALDSPGHRNGTVDVVFGSLATNDGTDASFNGVTCATYCHGGGALRGGTLNNPAWTIVDGTQAACGTCHGLPPPAPHPNVPSTSCGGCHPFIGLVPINPALHVDGVVERP